MFPSFLLGLFLRKRPFAEKWLSDHMLIPIGLYIILMATTFIIPKSDVYVTKLIIGLSGAISCFLLFKNTLGKMSTTPLLIKMAKLGGITLGIYVLQAILLEVLLPRYLDLTSLPIVWIVSLMPLLSLLALTICVFITNTINRSNIMGFLMFGNEYKR
jgi:peptidoglycan/LPS O-acetylase OafA/YrhL